MSTPKVLVIDDNREIRYLVRAALENDGYDVSEAANGKDLARELERSIPDVFLLDVVLPGETGLSLIAKIRQSTNAPIIVISGKGELVDKIVGLEMGGDDYLAKPFDVKELCARVRAQIRRYRGQMPEQPKPSNQNKIKFGGWTLDRARFQAFSQSNQSANLTLKEFRLLEVFVLAPNEILTREQLLDRSRANDFNVTDRAIDTQIVRIRKKLEDPALAKPIIQTVHGIGYILALDGN